MENEKACQDDKKTKKGPLSGVRIVDMSSIIMGPYATQIMADLGAEVIKIENVGGDLIRYAGKSPTPRMGPIYMQCNRNKKSLELDLTDPLSREALDKLIASADVFFTNVRLAGLERLNYDYKGVKAITPDILYVHCVGFGTEGPYGGRQAYDDLVQAASGVTELLQMSGTSSEPRYLPSVIADKTAGLHAVYATLAGLFHRQRTGEGQFVEVPMFESFVSFNMVENLYGHTFVPPHGPMAYSRSVDPNRKPFPTSDGYIAIVPYRDDQWLKLFELAGRNDLMDDPRFATFKDRTENITKLYAAVAKATKTKTTQEWLFLLEESQIPYMPLQSLSEVLNDEHLQKSGFFVQREHPTEGSIVTMKHPVRFDKTPAVMDLDPPKLGQDTAKILTGLGYGVDQIQAIIDKTAGKVIQMNA